METVDAGRSQYTQSETAGVRYQTKSGEWSARKEMKSPLPLLV